MPEGARGMEQAWWALLLSGLFAILLGAYALMSPPRSPAALLEGIAVYWIARGFVELGDVAAAAHLDGRSRAVAAVVSLAGGLLALASPLVPAALAAETASAVPATIAVVSGLAFITHGADGGNGPSTALGVFDLVTAAALLAPLSVPVLVPRLTIGTVAFVGGIAIAGVAFALRERQHPPAHVSPA